MSKIQFLDTQCIGICTADELRVNMASANARGYPVVEKLESNWRPLAIVGGGPSVDEDIDELRAWKSKHPYAEIWAVNGALGWLLARGITPDAMVMMDPHWSMAQFVECDLPEITYYMCSFCDPSVFDKLRGKNVVIWHAGDEIAKPPRGQGAVGGGPTILSRAPMLAYCLGYRDVTLFGADSSYRGMEEHSYNVDYAPGIQMDERMLFQLDDMIYETCLVFVHQAAYFQAIHHWYTTRGARFKIAGYGLGPAMLKAKMHSVEELTAA